RVGSRRSRSAAGVASTLPNPSGRNGSGRGPTRQVPVDGGAGTDVAVGGVVELPAGGSPSGGCGEPWATALLLEVASPTGGPDDGGLGCELPAQAVSRVKASSTAPTTRTNLRWW